MNRFVVNGSCHLKSHFKCCLMIIIMQQINIEVITIMRQLSSDISLNSQLFNSSNQIGKKVFF